MLRCQWFTGRFASINNDPSAGSPTETLLRLLLPLMIRFGGLLATSSAANRRVARDPNTSPDHSIGFSPSTALLYSQAKEQNNENGSQGKLCIATMVGEITLGCSLCFPKHRAPPFTDFHRLSQAFSDWLFPPSAAVPTTVAPVAFPCSPHGAPPSLPFGRAT
ncbi:hypothetical protein Syun_006777 [Stephania yunnanensis]|uniref:Uncharacterized protein n=1 Tax=Stephania yunnanensis TaxID=152371 RepID=A0AAP0Q1P8_9MAGN